MKADELLREMRGRGARQAAEHAASRVAAQIVDMFGVTSPDQARREAWERLRRRLRDIGYFPGPPTWRDRVADAFNAALDWLAYSLWLAFVVGLAVGYGAFAAAVLG